MAVSYTLNTREKNHEGKTVVTSTIVYSAENYPAGVGLPVTKEQLGFRNVIDSLIVIDQGGGYSPRFNGGKIRLYQQDPGVPGATELSEYPGGAISLTIKVVAVGW